MVSNDYNAIVVNYPNQIGDVGRYELRDQRNYFSKFEGGACLIFELALQNCVHGDLLTYGDQCGEIFDSYYQRLFDENSASASQYHDDRREFQRRVFDVYRYAKSSLACLGENPGFHTVRKILSNRGLDIGSFLLK